MGMSQIVQSGVVFIRFALHLLNAELQFLLQLVELVFQSIALCIRGDQLNLFVHCCCPLYLIGSVLQLVSQLSHLALKLRRHLVQVIRLLCLVTISILKSFLLQKDFYISLEKYLCLNVVNGVSHFLDLVFSTLQLVSESIYIRLQVGVAATEHVQFPQGGIKLAPCLG